MKKFKVGDKVTSVYLVGTGVIKEVCHPNGKVNSTDIYIVSGKHATVFGNEAATMLGDMVIHADHLKLYVEPKDITEKIDAKQILEKFMAGTKFKIDDVPTNSLDMLVNAIVRGNKIEEQKYIDINGFKVPEPCYDLSEISGYVFVVYLHDIVETEANKVPVYYSEAYYNGLVHMSYEAAQIHQEALLSFTKKNEKV